MFLADRDEMNRARGRAEAEAQMAALVDALLAQGCTDDLRRAGRRRRVVSGRLRSRRSRALSWPQRKRRTPTTRRPILSWQP